MDRVILVDKPAGRTSHDMVADVRRRLRETAPEVPRKGEGRVRVGHAGTLDPFATGLLLVLTGRATRAQRFFMGLVKQYETTVRYGWTSSTGDPEGELTETGRVPAWADGPLGGEGLPTGLVTQRPPAYSAIKVGGRRAYALARAGQEVEIPEREVHVAAFTRTAPDAFAITCSAGTYVRTLVADLGDAYCETLRRTAIGPFTVADAGTELALGDALARFLPVIELAGRAAEQAAHGVALPLEAWAPFADPAAVAQAGTEVALVQDADGPIALSAPQGDGALKPLVGFRA